MSVRNNNGVPTNNKQRFFRHCNKTVINIISLLGGQMPHNLIRLPLGKNILLCIRRTNDKTYTHSA